VLNLEEDSVGIALLGSASTVREGDKVVRTKSIASVPVGETILGRVINALGEPIDGGPALDRTNMRPIELKAIDKKLGIPARLADQRAKNTLGGRRSADIAHAHEKDMRFISLIHR
jgi:F0F1-type ATP synthase beta subunit